MKTKKSKPSSARRDGIVVRFAAAPTFPENTSCPLPPAEHPDAEIFRVALETRASEKAIARFEQSDTPESYATFLEFEKLFWGNYRSLQAMTPRSLAGACVIINWMLLVNGCEDDDMTDLLRRLIAASLALE
jgi:hypothetical protein